VRSRLLSLLLFVSFLGLSGVGMASAQLLRITCD